MEDPPGNPPATSRRARRRTSRSSTCSSARTARRSATASATTATSRQAATRRAPSPTRPRASGSSPDLPLTAKSRGNAVAIQIRVKGSYGRPEPRQLRPRPQQLQQQLPLVPHWKPKPFGTSVEPTEAQILAAPVQRAFRGNSLTSGSAQWLRLTTDPNCDGPGNPATPPPPALLIDDEAASQPTSGPADCFFVDMGLKGGIAQDQDEPAVLFNDGVGSSQMGALDCDPNINQGQILDRRRDQGLRALVRTERVRYVSAVPSSEQHLHAARTPARRGLTGHRSSASRRDRRAR